MQHEIMRRSPVYSGMTSMERVRWGIDSVPRFFRTLLRVPSAEDQVLNATDDIAFFLKRCEENPHNRKHNELVYRVRDSGELYRCFADPVNARHKDKLLRLAQLVISAWTVKAVLPQHLEQVSKELKRGALYNLS